MPTDMRRADLIVPYRPLKDDEQEERSVMSQMGQVMAMASMFMRNKIVSWLCTYLAVASIISSRSNRTDWASAAYGFTALIPVYIPMFLPSPAARAAAATSTPSGTPA